MQNAKRKKRSKIIGNMSEGDKRTQSNQEKGGEQTQWQRPTFCQKAAECADAFVLNSTPSSTPKKC